MLQGLDVSHWNTAYIANHVRDYMVSDFVIFKATEGITYKDPDLEKLYFMYTGEKNLHPSTRRLYGFYHFAHPENNNAMLEARNFLSTVKGHAGNCIYALDVEGSALKLPTKILQEWVYDFCEAVKVITGVNTIIYCSESAVAKVCTKAEKNLSSGLWVAKWGDTKPRKDKIKPYDTFALWQYVSKPIDRDYFNGTAEQFRLYCESV